MLAVIFLLYVHSEFWTNFKPYNIIKIILESSPMKIIPNQLIWIYRGNDHVWPEMRTSKEDVKIQQIGGPYMFCFGYFIVSSCSKA